MTMWMVRNNGGEYVEEFLKQQIVAVGWQDAGPLNDLRSRDQIIDRVKTTWPHWKPLKAVVSGSQLNKIVNIMKAGDRVVTYDPSKRVYHVGHISGEYQFDAEADDILANRRSVVWEGQVSRDKLSTPTKNSLGSSLSIFEVPETAAEEIDGLIAGKTDAVSSPEKFARSESDVATQYLLNDLRAKAKEFIKDKIVSLSWEDMQELIAGILRAMNYKTRVSPQGADRGKDIVASPDGFGFEQPRIVVEVKHRPNQQMGSPEIRSFLGGRHKDDRGLYVSTGGFSKEAKYEADRASIPLTLMDIDDLVDAVVEYYEQLDLDTRTLLPLSKIYWPSEESI
ncbi:restriction system protein [Bradyrhizobium elkanii]|uniref:restriction endonuclease n=1 Tax=Bradyrhizobium TaxID=374 RepID=UPI002167CC13|nr:MULTISPECIES: restriction endonuclease [Bradyrhizobium]MCS3933566.1 restriction system protein [Bradyrhizobium elkanii]MCS3974123.1 restriction system protein [Bradyrhizobium japonicum]